MKKIAILLIVFSFFISCKKKYTCKCATPDAHQGFINQETYHVKEKNEKDAQVNCFHQYEASGNSVNGIYCEVSKN